MNIETQTEQTQPKSFKRQAESGQAIVIMALMMIALLGMLGLAIDGGGLYFLWRDVRNATDAAVMAATYAKCTGGDIVTAGLNAADENGFDNNGTSNTVEVYNPPISGEAIGDDDFVQVRINANRPSYFIHLVYRGPLEVTNRAVGYCVPAFDPSKVPGAWTGGSCNNTFNWTGSQANITGGIHSEQDVKFTGSSAIVNGLVEYVRYLDADPSKVTMTPPASHIAGGGTDPLNLDIGLFAQGGEIANNIIDRGGYYLAVGPGTGNMTDYNINNHTWSPSGPLRGLYYVVGDANLGNSNTWDQTVGATVVATGVVDSNLHGANIRYYEGVMWTTPSNVQYPGVLFYSALDNPCSVSHTDAIKMRGNSMIARGVLYAPRGNIGVSGSSITIFGSLISDSVDYSGSSGTLTYDPSILPPRPPRINVAE